MSTPLAELKAERTAGGEVDALLSTWQELGFPTVDWEPGNPGAIMAEAFGRAIADQSTLIPGLTRGRFAHLARGGALDLLAENFYGLERAQPTFTRQRCTVTCELGTGPQTIESGFIARARSSGNRYLYGGESVKVEDGQSATVVLIAEEPGERYADQAGEIGEIVTPLPGLSITNPDPPVRQGADAEADSALAERCTLMWPALGLNVANGKLLLWIRAVSIEQGLGISRVRVRPSAEVPGATEVLLAGAAGSPGVETLAIVQSYLDARLGRYESARVRGATNRAVVSTGAVVVASAAVAAAKVAADLAWRRYLASLAIGGDSRTGFPGVIRLSELEQLLMDAGAIDVSGLQLNGAAVNLALALEEVPIVGSNPPSLSLTWTTA